MSISTYQVIECARTFLGTPFRDRGRAKGRGLDCVGLPLMVAGELGIKDTEGQPIHGQLYTAYSPQPINNIVLDLCAKHLVRVSLQDKQTGDILVMKVPHAPCHVGIYLGKVNGEDWLIHAYAGVDKVVEQPIDIKWQRRICAAFRFPGVE